VLGEQLLALVLEEVHFGARPAARGGSL
jgi:hypothetical protein